jgi:hypothetical protein
VFILGGGGVSCVVWAQDNSGVLQGKPTASLLREQFTIGSLLLTWGRSAPSHACLLLGFIMQN